jgi:hypothetical protein
LRSIAATTHKLIISASHGNGIVGAVGVINLLVGASVAGRIVVGKAMGKGNGADEGHSKKKEAALRLPLDSSIVNALVLAVIFCHDWACCFVHSLDECAWDET